MGLLDSIIGNGALLPLIIAVGVPLTFGSLIGISTFEDIQTWYFTLRRPVWVPPAPVFGQAWAVLYCLIGYASYQVYIAAASAARTHALKLYAVNLVLNLAWPIIFFKSKKLGLAQVENVALLGVAATTMSAFFRVSDFAGQLMIPYVCWIAFANLLNFSIWRNNPNATRIIEPLRDSAPNPGEKGYGGSNATASLSQSSRGKSRKALVVFSSTSPPVFGKQGARLRPACHRCIPLRPSGKPGAFASLSRSSAMKARTAFA